MRATPPPMRDRMPGAYCGPRCPHCRAEPGPACADKQRATRAVRHADRRALEAWLLGEYGSQPVDPLLDLSDCVHGCSGCIDNERCNFTCHDAATAEASSV